MKNNISNFIAHTHNKDCLLELIKNINEKFTDIDRKNQKLIKQIKKIFFDNIDFYHMVEEKLKKELRSLFFYDYASDFGKLLNHIKTHSFKYFYNKVNTVRILHFFERKRYNCAYFSSIFKGHTFKESFLALYDKTRLNIDKYFKVFKLLDYAGKRAFYYWIKGMFELKFKYIEQTKCIKNPNEEYLSSFFNFTDEETYVNCGCYDGKSLLYFYQYVNKKCSKLIGIDCVKKNISDAVDTMIKNNIPKEKYEILYNALGEKEETIFVKEEGMYNINEIDIKKGYQVKQVTLDTLFEDKPYTFLSLDVEGFEMGVLRGSEKIIRETKPKLAISAYHKYEDIIEIILYLHKINPGYKFSFMGEYINTFADLTLYCK